MAIQEDPSVAPAAPRANAGTSDGSPVQSGRAVAASRGVEWLSTGWRLFRRQAGIWILLALVFVLIVIAGNAIPGLGQLALTILMPVFAGGMMLGCRKVDRDEELELADLFAGFRRNTGALIMVGVIGLVLMIVAVISVMVVTGAGALLFAIQGETPSPAAIASGALLPGLLLLALTIPVNMAMWFAPALVVFHGEPAARAMLESFRGCLRNIVPLLIYGVILAVLAILASIPLFLGWLALGPVLVGSIYAGYRDIFASP